MNCGREPGGRRAGKVACEAATDCRDCWTIAGPDAPRKKQCLRILGGCSCTDCPFYLMLSDLDLMAAAGPADMQPQAWTGQTDWAA
jgi:hypothetical protein